MARIGDLRSIGRVRVRDPLISLLHSTFSLALISLLTLLIYPWVL